jgi:hypothetical protein
MVGLSREASNGMATLPELEEVERLLDEVTAFLIECGETYKAAMSGFIEGHLMLSLIYGTYIYKPDHFFMSYKLINEASVKLLGSASYDELTDGNVFACLDAGVKSDFNEMFSRAVAIAKQNGCKTVAYYRHNEGLKHYEVPNYVQ